MPRSMANRAAFRWILFCPIAALLLTVIPLAVRRLYPGALGCNSKGRDLLTVFCFDAAYVRSLVIYFVIVLTPVSLLLAAISSGSPDRRPLSRKWKRTARVAAILWVVSFFVSLSHTDSATYLARLDEGVLSMQWGPCPQSTGCLPCYENYTDHGNAVCWLTSSWDYHYVWKLPTILKRWLVPHMYTEASLHILEVPIWPLFAPIVAWTIVLWCRTRAPHADPHCAACGYNLTANVSGICPECGKPIPQDQPEPKAEA